MKRDNFSRRNVVSLGAGALASGCMTRPPDTAYAPLKALEARAGGRLGASFLDTATGRQIGYRSDERFAMCSSFKLALAAIVLHESDAGRLNLGEVIDYGPADMVSHHPVTGPMLGRGGLTIEALAKAAQLTSDNVAANLLLRRLDGPAGFTLKMRAAGDPVMRLDRMEPEMNLVRGDDIRDTTTPAAMARVMSTFLVGDYLKPATREKLISWMIDTRTGLKRLRAGFPADWLAGDKTGTGMAPNMPDTYVDVAIAWPPRRAPLIVTAYYNATTMDGDIADAPQAVLADVARLATAWLTSGSQ